ncbi:MAG TPA: proton-conducting transporter membrane subunit [Anaerolineae bacterium]|nr:proton-conducting transporter membrane subunit [Anaerolineae bacterium]
MGNPSVLAPLLALGLGAFLVYLVGRIVSRRNETLAALTAAVYAVSLALAIQLGSEVTATRQPAWPVSAQAPVLRAEPGGMLVTFVGLGLGLLVALYSGRYLALDHRYEHYYPLLLLLSGGLTGMVMAVDLFTLYLFTVLTSAAAYVLVAFRRRTETAIEAGFKYAIMGATAGILLLAGVGHYYRETGTLSLPLSGRGTAPWGALGMAFVLSGYAIKGALVPAHTWLPDAHGRAPSSISAMLSGIVIEVNLYVLVKAGLGMGWPARRLGWLLVGLSLANMTVGNALALMQVYGKRLLGYSSIAQVGYIMMALGLGLAYNRPEAVSAGFFLLVAHAAMKGLAFLCKGICHFYCDATLIEELDGIVGRVPVTAACFVVGLAGLAGVPLLAGFVGKWQLVVSALDIAGPWVSLAIAVFVVNSLVSLGYYLPLVGRILKRPDNDGERIRVSAWMLVPTVVLALVVVGLGVFPQPVLALTREAARFLLTWGQQA